MRRKTTGRELRTTDRMNGRALIEIVGFLRDTPDIKSFLHVTGHHGNACCRRCSFHISNKQALHNRYLLPDGNGMKTAYRFSLLRYSAAHEIKIPLAMQQNL